MKFKVDSEVELQIMQHHHAEPLYKLIVANRAVLGEWLPWVEGSLSSQDTLDFIDTTIAQFKDNKGFQSVIFVNGSIAGAIGFHAIDWAHLKCSLGYWLAGDFQGRGVMTRACKFIVSYAFEHYQLHRVEIRCGEGNLRSRAIPQRLGFQLEGLARECEKIGDRYVSHAVYGMLARECQKVPVDFWV